MAKLKSTFNVFTLFFLALSIFSLIESVNNRREWKYMEANGVRVSATIVDVVELWSGGDTPDHDVYFRYEYDGEEYTYVYFNYPDGRRIGKTVTGYVCPDNPEQLILSDGRTPGFFFWFLLVFAVISGVGGYMSAKEK